MSFMVTIEHGILNGDTEIKNVAFEYEADYAFKYGNLNISVVPMETPEGSFRVLMGDEIDSKMPVFYTIPAEVKEWLSENTHGDYVIDMDGDRIYFNSVRDAVYFRLRW